MPAFVLAPPLPPVGRVCVSAREDALEVSSENTSIAFPLGLFVLVITSGRCPLWPAAAIAPAIVRHVAVRQARKFSLGSFCISIGISWEFSVKSRPVPAIYIDRANRSASQRDIRCGCGKSYAAFGQQVRR